MGARTLGQVDTEAQRLASSRDQLSAIASAFSDERPATATAAPASLISSEVTRPMPP